MQIFIDVNDYFGRANYARVAKLQREGRILPIHKPFVDEIYNRNRQAAIAYNWKGTFDIESKSNKEISEKQMKRFLEDLVHAFLASWPVGEVKKITDEEWAKLITDKLPDLDVKVNGVSLTMQLGTYDEKKGLSPYLIPIMPQKEENEAEKQRKF